MDKEQLQQAFRQKYNSTEDRIYFAPGRVNLIGEHIDYNGGLVMPCAITFGTYLLVRKNNENRIRLSSLNFNEEARVPLAASYSKVGDNWFNYPLGVLNYFLKGAKEIQGVDILFYGNIPIGSGLSSSASIEMATAYALNDLFKCGYSKLELVKMSKLTENEFIGVNSGIMDQFAVAYGEKDKALVLDCASLQYDAVNCNLQDYVLAIINTNKPRKLAESKYNERVGECALALKDLRQKLDITQLCDIEPETFYDCNNLIHDEVITRRAKHVVEENARVKKAAKALSQNDLKTFGQLMYESHLSLKDLYEVSGKELDAVVAYCKNDPNVAGARMTGAGFGGCAIALVKKNHFETFSSNINVFYKKEIGYAPEVYQSLIGPGVGTFEDIFERF